MKVIIVGKTDCILNLNKIGVPVRGKEQAVVEVDTEEKKNEILVLKKAGYLDILEIESPIVAPPDPISDDKQTKTEEKEETSPTPTETKEIKKRKGGRPKGAKNKKTQSEQQRVNEAEAKTQEMGSRVVIGTGNGNVESKMKRSYEGQIEESEATKESIKAMEEIIKEEDEGKKKIDAKVDESKLDPSEQMGRQAIFIQEGEQKKSTLSKSIIPGQENIREVDPFIDNKSDDKDPAKNAFIDKPEDIDDDSFLKI